MWLRVDLHRSVQYRLVRGSSAVSCERAAHGRARPLGSERGVRGPRGGHGAHLAYRLAGAALEQRLEGRVPVERGVGLVKIQRLDEGYLGAPSRTPTSPPAAVHREGAEQRLLNLAPLVRCLRRDLVRHRGGAVSEEAHHAHRQRGGHARQGVALDLQRWGGRGGRRGERYDGGGKGLGRQRVSAERWGQ